MSSVHILAYLLLCNTVFQPSALQTGCAHSPYPLPACAPQARSNSCSCNRCAEETCSLTRAVIRTGGSCEDSWSWSNPYGKTCVDYALEGWCKNGNFMADQEWVR